MQNFDFIIVGLGTAGSAASMTLARRGFKVLGIDALRPPHNRASHHGGTRSVRRAYLEGRSYVPMAMRSWELWRRLERDVGRDLLVATGNLTIGPPDCPAVTEFLISAKSYDIPYDFLTAKEITRRWPQIVPSDTFVGGLEKEAGIVFPHLSISAFLTEATKAGAELFMNSVVKKVTEKNGVVSVSVNGKEYRAARVLVSSGGWTGRLLGLAPDILKPNRVPVHWFRVNNRPEFSLGNFPVNFWQVPEQKTIGEGEKYREFYSLPTIAEYSKVKAAFHNGLQPCDPDKIDRKVSDFEVEDLRTTLSEYIPALQQSPIDSEVCIYTLTPDGNFYLGQKTGSENIFAAALAGHGFKFAPVLGEVLADMLTDVPSEFDVDIFSPDRF